MRNFKKRKLVACNRSNFLRFLASGAVNTLASYAMYLVLLQVFTYRCSYAIAFSIGIVMAYLLNRYFVFRSPSGRLGPIFVTLIYLGQFAIGMGLVSAWVQWLNGPVALAPFFSVVLTLPVTFFLNRKVFNT